MRQAFELFATGDYTLDSLQTKLTALGFLIPATHNRPAHPISRTNLHKLLRNRYYTGDVPYKGEWYPGRHEPLISRELFERVQRVLDSHAGAGVRFRKHNHYLKGIFFCKECHNRLILFRAKGNGGIYYYFYCHGTKLVGCQQPYVALEDLERQTADYFRKVALTDTFRQTVIAYFDQALADEQTSNHQLEKHLTKRLGELEAQEDRYLDLLGDHDWPQDKLKTKMATIREERTKLATQLTNLESTLQAGRQLIHAATELLANPEQLYRQSDPAGRRLLALTIFGRLYVHTKTIVDHDLQEPFSALVTVQRQQAGHGPRTNTDQRRSGPVDPGWGDLAQLRAYNRDRDTFPMEDAPALSALTSTNLLNLAFAGHGSHKPVLVEIARRYANRPDLLAELGRVATRVAERRSDEPASETPYDHGMARRGRQRRLSELLTPEDIRDLIASFQAGTAKHRLAAHYGISESSVKRLLRAHGVSGRTNKVKEVIYA